MSLVGYQHMLLGLLKEEIVVEIQIPSEMVDQMEATTEFAHLVMEHVGWETKVIPDHWEIESQALHRR